MQRITSARIRCRWGRTSPELLRVGKGDHWHDAEGRDRVAHVARRMTIADLGGAVLGPIDPLAAALIDPRRRERTAAQLLFAYVAVWTLYGVLAKGSQDVHFDMGE